MDFDIRYAHLLELDLGLCIVIILVVIMSKQEEVIRKKPDLVSVSCYLEKKMLFNVNIVQNTILLNI